MLLKPPSHNQKPGKKAATVAAAVDAPTTGALQQWLKTHGDREGFMFAREFLLKGAPYKGTSGFDDKEAVKELGATWLANPLKIKGERDGITGGWWVAGNEIGLAKLIGAPLSKKKKKNRIWTPLDVPADEVDAVARLIHEFEGSCKMKDRLDREERTASEAARALATAARHLQAGIPPDEEPSREALRALGVEYDDAMGRAASAAPALGPHVGISPANRLLRGIRLTIVSVAQANAKRFGRGGGRRARDGRPADADADVAPVNYKRSRVVDASTGSFMFGESPNAIPFPNPNELKRCIEAIYEEDQERIRRSNSPVASNRRTWCDDCHHEVLEQFNTCGCTDEWFWCSSCSCGHRRGQPCACSVGDAAWQRQQEDVAREARREAEQAAAEAAAGGSGGGAGAVAVGMNWDDDD